MPRTPRLDFPGATHHVYNRGACHAPIFFEPADQDRFLSLLAKFPGRFGVHVLAYALMPNHYHLVVQTPRANLSAAMQHLLGTYVRGLNDMHDRDGSPYRGRFANRLVETEDYLRTVLGYVHLNPVRAGLADHPVHARWTSHAAAVGHARAPSWLDVSWVDTYFGGPAAFAEYVERTEPTGELCPPPPTDVLTSPYAKPADTLPVPSVIAAVASITNVPRHRLRCSRGRPGEFLAWTLMTRAALTHREIGAVLRISRGGVTQRIARFEAWAAADPVGCAWQATILLRLH